MHTFLLKLRTTTNLTMSCLVADEWTKLIPKQLFWTLINLILQPYFGPTWKPWKKSNQKSNAATQTPKQQQHFIRKLLLPKICTFNFCNHVPIFLLLPIWTFWCERTPKFKLHISLPGKLSKLNQKPQKIRNMKQVYTEVNCFGCPVLITVLSAIQLVQPPQIT